MVRRAPPRRSGQAGRPETGLLIDPDAGLLIGAGVIPGAVRLIATSLDGTILDRCELRTANDPEDVVAAVRAGVARLMEGRSTRLRGIGAGVPGLINRDGHVILAPSLGWRDVPIALMLRARLACSVQIDNDAKAAAFAERLFGVCRGCEDFAFVFGNGGIGGGLHLGGKLYRGCDGMAGELGHMKIVPNGRSCVCGNRGCVEAYVSVRAITQRLDEIGLTFTNELDGFRDGESQGIFDEAGSHLGEALALLVKVVSPRIVVLAGDLAPLAPRLLPAAERTLEANVLTAMRTGTKIFVSTLGEDAVAMGGVALALQGFMPLPT